jgi:hypothetical protein
MSALTPGASLGRSTNMYTIAFGRLASMFDQSGRIAASISDPEIKTILRIHEAIAKVGVKEELRHARPQQKRQFLL